MHREEKVKPSLGLLAVFIGLVLTGAITFAVGVTGGQPQVAWHAYHLNVLFWSAIAQGGFLVSVVMHLTKARWSRPLENLAETFAAFFPASLVLFIILFLGSDYLFPWLHEEFHGPKSWLHLPFLVGRDLFGLLLLYGLGLAYLYCGLRRKLPAAGASAPGGKVVAAGAGRHAAGDADYRRKQTIFAVLYVMAYALVLTLLGFDLVMSMEPPWFSTLFGGYLFAKAFYMGLAALMWLAAATSFCRRAAIGITAGQLQDLGKLLFAFCLVWADFFYIHLLLTWYGNFPEEAFYVIKRVLGPPWRQVAWWVFVAGFAVPFAVLLNRRVKSIKLAMVGLCTLILGAVWFEHLLLLAPAWYPQASALPLGPEHLLISGGFFGLMALAICTFIRRFPELFLVASNGDSDDT